MHKLSQFTCAIHHWLGWAVFAALFSMVTYLFYLGGYRRLLVDESSSFAIELTMRILDANKDAKLLVLGNSTVAEGFRASSYNKVAGPRTSLNLGIGSAHFYLFEKIVDLALARGFRPHAVLLVLTPETLSLRPGYDLLQNDLTLMKTELDSSDYLRVWRHSPSTGSYVEYAGDLALRPALYTTDVRDLVTHVVPRAHKIMVTQQWLKTAGNEPEALETDNQYAVCEADPLRELEKSLAAERSIPGSARMADLERVWAGYSVRAHQPLAVDSFQAQRLENLLKYLASHVPRVYVALAPYYDPDFDAYPAEYRRAFSDTVEQVTSRTSVKLLPEFETDCSMFFDTVHLNHAGGDKFTQFLRSQIDGD
ncbi:MAG TPA: hypothetical protein VMZ30_19810 [Pyrinomonadaceae bacterium]|nr:hypothetical protein [Pyrinomonadaceae bacterium]